MKSEVRNWLTKWRLLGSLHTLTYEMLCTVPKEAFEALEEGRGVFVAEWGDDCDAERELGIYRSLEESYFVARLANPRDRTYVVLARGSLGEARQAVRAIGGYAKRVRRRQAGKTRAKYRRRRGGKALGWLTKTANFWIK